jgi:MFS family permease
MILTFQASYLIALKSAASLLALIVLIPGLALFFDRILRTNSLGKDKSTTQITLALAVTGSLVMFWANTPATLCVGLFLFALGHGFSVPARSLVTALVDQKHLGLLYSMISTVVYAGACIASPLFAKSFSWGMKLGEAWYGMPFLVASGLFAVALFAISAIRLKRIGNETPTVYNGS